MYDNQKAVDVCVFQGENRDARKNTLIGDFRIEGLSPLPAGSEIVMGMKLDLDGVLRCTATEKATGKNKQFSIPATGKKVRIRKKAFRRSSQTVHGQEQKSPLTLRKQAKKLRRKNPNLLPSARRSRPVSANARRLKNS